MRFLSGLKALAMGQTTMHMGGIVVETKTTSIKVSVPFCLSVHETREKTLRLTVDHSRVSFAIVGTYTPYACIFNIRIDRGNVRSVSEIRYLMFCMYVYRR